MVSGNQYGDGEGAHQHEQQRQHFQEIVKRVSEITRRRPRWEQTLQLDFPSFNFLDPSFLPQYIKNQNNTFISLRFFHWLSSQSGFSPDPFSCNVLFGALVKADACNAARSFLESTNFNPNPNSLEAYTLCLCKAGLVEEAISVFGRLKEVGFCPSIASWNSALKAFIRAGRTDFVWELYGEMTNSGVVPDIDTVGCLVQAFCDENRVSEGYNLLMRVIEDGVVPRNAVFNKLISRLIKDKAYGKVSDMLHTMIARNRAPDIFTYQEVVNGLCKQGREFEGLRVLRNLKGRGYAPDRVMYTTVIHGLCRGMWFGNARKLWFEMIRKGFLPNEYAYNSMIFAYSKVGNVKECWKMYREMCDKGYGEKTVSYNVMIQSLFSNGKEKEAQDLFEEMSRKGVPCDQFTYNILIKGYCIGGKILEDAKLLFKHGGKILKRAKLLFKLLDQGIQPLSSSYDASIAELCWIGYMENAEVLWHDMQSRGLKPTELTNHLMIAGICRQRSAVEAKEFLATMLHSQPRRLRKTFDVLIRCLLQRNRLDDTLHVLNCMLNMGLTPRQCYYRYFVTKLCKENSPPVETYLRRILERN